MDSIFDNAGNGLCVICSMPTSVRDRTTCSEKCHEEFIKLGEKKFGTKKKVVDGTTGLSYEVPTRDLIEKGLAWKDLTKYPVWKDEDDQNNRYDKKTRG